MVSHNMGLSLSLFIFTTLLVLFSLFHISVTSPSNSSPPSLCHEDESSALLQFKESFVIIDVDDAFNPSTYPKVGSWKLRGGKGDCCSWGGVECDKVTGYVIGLDLSASFLYGSINSSSSLFHLVHLKRLNLASNHFNYSQIPSGLGHLSKLTYLNLSNSFFSGQIPPNISDLSKLSFLDLSQNDGLVLKKPDFRSLVRNLTSLEVLNLDEVDISSTVPDILANASSLKSLSLADCGLYGEFSAEILQLPKLEMLCLSDNQNLNGNLPDFHSSSPLGILWLSGSSFSGELPASIGNLNSLVSLDLYACNFSGKLPSSLGNLTQLDFISLSENPFTAQNTSSLSWIGDLTKLTYLDLETTNINGEIYSFFGNLTQLSTLSLSWNQLSGPIPSSLMNLTQLTLLDLSFNELQGTIPRSISKLKNLEYLNFYSNKLSGVVELDMLFKLRRLSTLLLSLNSLSLVVNSTATSNSTSQEFYQLGLGSCNLSEFPTFLRHQDKLRILDLSSNNIHGRIPKWLWNTSTSTLIAMDLSFNLLTGFEVESEMLPWAKIRGIELKSNLLETSLPLPPPTTQVYSVSGNKINGEIPASSFCNLTALFLLDLHDNNLSGKLPSCLANSSNDLEVLDLGGNTFDGIISQMIFPRACKLKMIALNHNQLHRVVPRSVSSCAALEFLNLGNNFFKDVFPAWLGALPTLKVLILRSNKLHGVLKSTAHGERLEFPRLCIIDLSQNNLRGQLPADYFLKWKAMQKSDTDGDQLEYLLAPMTFDTNDSTIETNFTYSMSMTDKGVERNYTKILDFFIAIDFSCNKFHGEIPRVIDSLKGLHLLNLSNNNLDGPIPLSLGNLMNLESLDLSQNNLSGEIPQQLVQLNFLSAFNVSHNPYLTGPVPQGKQFDTFVSDSYEGNPSLCGKVLPRKCQNSEALPPAPSTPEEDDHQDSGSPFQFGWKPVVIGYSCGLIFGLVIGHIVFKRKYDWLMMTFTIRSPRTRRGRGGRRRNC